MNGTLGPKLLWDPGLLVSPKPLKQEGKLDGSPFASLRAALEAVQKRRKQKAAGSPRDNVFLISYSAGKRWMVFEYSESRLGTADLKELDLADLPLGGSITDPRTYIWDGRGRLGKITVGASDGEYAIREVDVATVAGAVSPTDVYLPAVVPRRMANHSTTAAWQPRVALRPGRDADLLSDALAWVDQNLPPSVKVKAGGWRHSWAPVCATDGVYIHPENMRGVTALAGAGGSDEAALLEAGVDHSKLFAVFAGTRIREINKTLWDNGRALPYLGGWDGQTLGGVLPTGTHGSALRHGPLAEMVRSVDMVCFDGSTVRIEPAAGAITSPANFKTKRKGWKLIQDDDVFRAVLISMGTVGVFFRLIIEARERFWMKEVRTVTKLSTVVSVLRKGNIYHLTQAGVQPTWIAPQDDRAFDPHHPKPAFHLELLWNPHSEKVVVTTRHPVDPALFDNGKEPAWFANAPVRDLLRVLKLDAMADEYSRPDIPELLSEHFSSVLDEAVEVILGLAPGLIPGFLDGGLDQMADPDGYTQRSYKVFNVGEGANSIPAQSATISVSLADDMWLDGIGVVQAVAQKMARERKLYHTGPISLRFVRGSPLLLADPVDVCKFELIFGGDDDRVKRISEELVRAHYHALYAKFGADVRFHWGQLTPSGTIEVPGASGQHRVRESFPRYDDWRRIRDQLDPAGRGLNRWQELILP